MYQIIKRFLLTTIFLVNSHIFWSQETISIKTSYETIEKNLDNPEIEKEKKWEFIKIYIKKSKKEKSLENLLYAYRYAGSYSDFPQNVKYADSALKTANVSQSKKLITAAYLNRGFVFMRENKYQNALDDILMANKLSRELNDDYQINKTIYFIAQNKIYLGLYEEANQEMTSCLEYFKKNASVTNSSGKDYQMFYMYSLMSYIDSNTKLRKHKENQRLLLEAFDYIEKNNLSQYQPYFVSSKGIDEFYQNRYSSSIQYLSKAIRLYNDSWAHITEIFYLGLAHWKLNHPSVAIKYFEEIEKEYDKLNKILDPEFRAVYEILIKYYDEEGNTEKQLFYIERLMKLDQTYQKNFKYLYTRINKEYDTQKLISEKNRIEKKLEFQRYFISIGLLIMIGFLVFVGWRYKKLQKSYEQKFDSILNEKQKTKTTAKEEITIIKENQSILSLYDKVPGLNPLLVEDILIKLKDFEENLKFLDPQTSQKGLCEEFNTNSSYFSKIINGYKGKNFNAYINDLRLDYIVNEIKNDPRLINLDIKELAKKSGFNNAENFSDHFKRKFGLKPSYFIKKMRETIKTPSLLHNPTSEEETA